MVKGARSSLGGPGNVESRISYRIAQSSNSNIGLKLKCSNANVIALKLELIIQ